MMRDTFLSFVDWETTEREIDELEKLTKKGRCPGSRKILRNRLRQEVFESISNTSFRVLKSRRLIP